MLARKNYTQEEIDAAKSAIAAELAAYDELAKAAASAETDELAAALGALEAPFFNALTLALDRYFVHRLIAQEGKDGNPLNEVRVICESLVTNNGRLLRDKRFKLTSETSVAKFEVGEQIAIGRQRFESLATAFFEELGRRFT